jgi:chaperone required for assembly of F1-ATPase
MIGAPARRFWREVTVEGRGIRLDGRVLKTPARAELILPTDSLAYAIAAEWRDVEGTIDPRAMRFTSRGSRRWSRCPVRWCWRWRWRMAR